MTGRPLAIEQFVYLTGRPHIREFVRFVRTRGIDGRACSDLELTREWQAASRHIRSLQPTEAALANLDELAAVPEESVAASGVELPGLLHNQTLAALPSRWAFVELDRLMVWQKYVNSTFAARLAESFPTHPTLGDLLRIAAGREETHPPLHVTMLTGNRFAFASASTDVQVLGTVPLSPDSVQGYTPVGRAQSVIAVFVGYGINVMLAVQMGNRVLLANGTHRAYALRARGIERVPCVVIRVSDSDDLDLLGLPISHDQVRTHFNTARPSLLKDYFDPKLHKSVLVPCSDQLIELELKFSESRVHRGGRDVSEPWSTAETVASQKCAQPMAAQPVSAQEM